MLPRNLQIFIHQTLPLLPDNVLVIGESGIPFSKAANLLGQEFDHILFDARQGIHLEALAIAAGTLKAGGTLCILLSEWEQLGCQIDVDSLRWNGQNPIATPNFIAHFKQCLCRHHFPIVKDESAVIFSDVFSDVSLHPKATQEQQQIITQILQEQADLYFLTAKRGRGKSALLGLLANQLQSKIYLTAPNKNAVHSVNAFSDNDIEFIAPDALAQALQDNATFSQNAWLLVDEAAMIPLPLLQQFSQHFRHIVFSTTIHSYEGTGRGFELKFKQKITRTFQHLELTQPLRWPENDPLEGFIDELLLLNAEDEFPQMPYQEGLSYQISECRGNTGVTDFYGLMTLAHYRTSPIDLRRLLDGENQRFYVAQSEKHLLGAIWALEEGSMDDPELIEQIQQGKRRPKGNLVPQALCFHENLPQACRLRSLRISRIAVQPNWQQKGIGQELVNFLQTSKVDFLSVSFGYTPELATFWQKCGFILVYLGEHQEASSGCYSAIALKGISLDGMRLVENASAQFQRNIALSSHPLAEMFKTQIDWMLTEQDWQSLENFAYFHRTLFSTLPAIRRLLKSRGSMAFPLLSEYLTKKQLSFNKKKGVEYFRLEIKQFLQQESFKS